MNKVSIFLDSSWRTGSTYVWSKFRAVPSTYCYFEPLNEDLEVVTPALVDIFVPWAFARHPKLNAPYYDEFRPLLQSDRGIQGYSVEFAYDSYLADRFVRLPKLQNYFSRLIEFAHQRSRTPVFGCVRTSLRLNWFRHHMPGIHIFILRDPRRQFISYLRQAANGNPYFLERAWVILGANQDNPAFIPLRQVVNIPAFKGSIRQRNAFYAGYSHNADKHQIYVIFYYLHVLTMRNIVENCQAILDIDLMSKDSKSARRAESEIKALTGMDISFSDCNIETYESQLERSARFFIEIERAVDKLITWEPRRRTAEPPIRISTMGDLSG
jgi:hypothetical protein